MTTTPRQNGNTTSPADAVHRISPPIPGTQTEPKAAVTVGAGDKAFTGSVPKIYEKYLVPLIFQDYAADLVRRVQQKPGAKLLEIAAGTGVVTRALARALPATTAIVATDLNQAMLDEAALVGTPRPVEWKVADALSLPFPDQSFDTVVCQFGVMFFPDKAKAFAEARRVLKPGGTFVFNVWSDIGENEIPDEITGALAALYPDDPPRFLPRTPHGYCDRTRIEQDLKAGGFSKPQINAVNFRSRADNARDAVIGYCQGTPLRGEIESRGDLEAATDAAARAIAERFGTGKIDGKLQALVVTVTK